MSKTGWRSIAAAMVVAGAAWLGLSGSGKPLTTNVYPYNFTSAEVDYRIQPGMPFQIRAGKADGREAHIMGFNPPDEQTPMTVQWRYATGPQAAPRGEYPYTATLKLPPRPKGDVVVELRFYPEQKVMARYAPYSLSVPRGNVDPAVQADEWVSNQ